MKNDALIGYSGFVGSTLMNQASFQAWYRSTNIADIAKQSFDTVICAAAPAQKWRANQEPAQDLLNIKRLMTHLEPLACKQFILISTVDVFKEPVAVDESTLVVESALQPYGLHRYQLEQFVRKQFPKHLIVRLPGLVGPGLRKNIIFDFCHTHNLQAIDSRHVFQFYPIVNLWYDIQIALNASLSLIHLTAEPITVSAVAQQGFGKIFSNHLNQAPIHYDMRSQYADLWGTVGAYQYPTAASIQAIRTYAQSEAGKPPCD